MTTKREEYPTSASPLLTWARLRVLLLLVLIVLLVWLGVKGWRIGRAVQSLLDQQAVAEMMLAEGITGIDPAVAAEMVQIVRQNVVTLRQETAVFMPITPYLGWLPQVGPLATAAPQLMEMANAGTETAVYAFAGLQPALTLLQTEENSGSPLPQLVNILADARPNLQLAQQSFQRVVAARNQISSTEQFPERIQTAFQLFDVWLPLAQDGLVMVQVLPEMMGHNGPRSYLLLAQNEDELRATGGFISGIGLLTLDNGQILGLDFQDASTFDAESLTANSGAYGYPPQPLQELMGADYFLLRDANYWPDFPITAQKVIELYQLAQPETQIDGVIAIDQQFIALLVEATGPVTVAGSDTVITANNAVDSFRNAFNIQEGQSNREWFQNRKAFLSTFSAAIRQKIESEPASVDMVTLAQNMITAINARHLQLFMVDETVTAVLTQLDWDGRLENPAGQDFLLVLDTNMGFNKTNLYIERSIQYEVDLATPSQPAAHLTVTYRHTGPSSEEACLQWVSYADAPTYQEVADQCYFNFLRVYVPLGSQLNWATQHIIPGEMLVTGIPWQRSGQAINEFADFTTFTNFIMVPRSQTLTTELSYILPETAVRPQANQQTYQLWLRKQAGSGSEPITIILTLPEGATVLDFSAPQAATVDGRIVTFTFDLTEDTLLSLDYK
jgi:Protein of unknown function (DUF4012)